MNTFYHVISTIFFHDILLDSAARALKRIAQRSEVMTKGTEILFHSFPATVFLKLIQVAEHLEAAFPPCEH